MLSNKGLGRVSAKFRKLLFSSRKNAQLLLHIPSNGSIEKVSGQLSRLSEDLEKSCKSVEGSFIYLGDNLRTIYSDVGNLMQQMNASVTLIGGGAKDSLLSKIGTIAEGSLEELKDGLAKVSENLRHVDSVVEHLANLSTRGQMIEKMIASLRVVGLNMNIESSRSTESREMFGIVAQDITTLSETVADIVKQFMDQSDSARFGQLNTHKKISESLVPLNELAHDAEKGARDSVVKIESFMALTLKALEKAGQHSHRISRQVGEVVAGIQFHDDMSQRIEHITSSLAEVERICKVEVAASGGNDSDAEKLSSAHSLLTLQVAQLSHIVSEIDEIYNKTIKAFKEIMDEVGKLAETLSTLGVEISEIGNAVETQHKDPFTDLKSSFEHLKTIQNQGTVLFDEVSATVAKASETTRILSGHAKQVSGINLATHLMALNAIIKAAHLGDKGSTLEILAQEVSRLSDQSYEFVDAVEKIFHSLTISTRQLSPRDGGEGSQASVNQQTAISLEQGIQEISKCYETFKVDSKKSIHSAQALKHAVSQASSNLNFLKDLADNLNEHLGQLEEIVEALSLWKDQRNKYTASETGKQALRYTMHKEREIHQQLFGPVENWKIGKKTYMPADSRVEQTQNQASKEIGPESGPKNLYHKPEKQTPEPMVETEPFADDKRDTDDDFGDNVELF